MEVYLTNNLSIHPLSEMDFPLNLCMHGIILFESWIHDLHCIAATGLGLHAVASGLELIAIGVTLYTGELIVTFVVDEFSVSHCVTCIKLIDSRYT